jgi:hypothetical protein
MACRRDGQAGGCAQNYRSDDATASAHATEVADH